MSAANSAWTDVGAASEVTNGARLDTEIDGYYVAVVRHQGRLFAFEDRCTHDGESLLGADLEADSIAPCGVVICPRHGARFCLATGAALTPPAYESLRLFAVREHEGRIELQGPLETND